MDKEDIPIGKRFSHVYINKGEPQQDSTRLRKRLSAFCNQHFNSLIDEFAREIKLELGVDVPHLYVYNIDDFFTQANLRDVLDSITIIWKVLDRKFLRKDDWIEFVQRHQRHCFGARFLVERY